MNNKRLSLFLLLFISIKLFSQQTIIQYLSGTDKDNTVQWEFMVNNGRKANQWATIPVPSCWEMQGYGTYSYYQDIKMDWNHPGMHLMQFDYTLVLLKGYRLIRLHYTMKRIQKNSIALPCGLAFEGHTGH
ncbi:MAG: hypothetical protein V4676_04565 [Bacteroidota bacterium]